MFVLKNRGWDYPRFKEGGFQLSVENNTRIALGLLIGSRVIFPFNQRLSVHLYIYSRAFFPAPR